MDPITIAAATSAIAGLGQGLMNRSSGKAQAKAYNNAINLMREQMARKYSGLYGANATADSMSTGDLYQDYLLAQLAKEVQTKEIQAARINNAQANLTDKEAQARAFVDLLVNAQSNNGQTLANASINSRRMGLNNAANLVYQNSIARANSARNAFNQSRQVTNNNLQRIGQGTNLNTGSIADNNRQQAQNMYQNANSNYQAAANNLANTMTAQGQAKANTPSYGGILGSGLMAGLQTYGQGALMNYGAQNGWFGGTGGSK